MFICWKTYTNSFFSGPHDWVKCSNATISEALQKGGTTIAVIVISTSKIGRVGANAFSAQIKSLSSINLNNCGIRDIDSQAFAGLVLLKKLSLPNNNITEVKPGWFDGLLSLEQIDLSFNSIRTIEPAVYTKLGLLQRLNLNENKLECLEPKDLESLRSLAKIRIEGNRLTLQCRAKVTSLAHSRKPPDDIFVPQKSISHFISLRPRANLTKSSLRESFQTFSLFLFVSFKSKMLLFLHISRNVTLELPKRQNCPFLKLKSFIKDQTFNKFVRKFSFSFIIN